MKFILDELFLSPFNFSLSIYLSIKYKLFLKLNKLHTKNATGTRYPKEKPTGLPKHITIDQQSISELAKRILKDRLFQCQHFKKIARVFHSDIAKNRRVKMDGELLNKVLEYYREGSWRKILNLNETSDNKDALKLLWVWPSEQNLKFLKKTIEELNCQGITSIGCGCGLLEWIIKRSTGKYRCVSKLTSSFATVRFITLLDNS